MSDLISREYMKSLGATCIASRSKNGTLFPIVSIDELQPADPTHPTPSNTLGALDCVDRNEAIKNLEQYKDLFSRDDGDRERYVLTRVIKELKAMPSAQPDLDEWCTDCKEYDKDKHCCPRWNRVIREALKDAQPQKGKWLKAGTRKGIPLFECSLCECGDEVPTVMGKPSYNFCPNCGADMRGDNNDS